MMLWNKSINETRLALKHKITNELLELKGSKFVKTLSVTFEKVTSDNIITKTAYFHSSPKTVIYDMDIKEDLALSSEEIRNKIAVWLSEGPGWTVDD